MSRRHATPFVYVVLGEIGAEVRLLHGVFLHAHLALAKGVRVLETAGHICERPVQFALRRQNDGLELILHRDDGDTDSVFVLEVYLEDCRVVDNGNIVLVLNPDEKNSDAAIYGECGIVP